MGHGPCHLVGAAGVGMNPLAQALLAAGFEVTGSDRYLDQGRDLDVIPKLRRAGVRFFPQDGSGVTADVRAVVVSTAIEPGNPDLEAAARLGVPVKHRAEMLAELAEGREAVAITGTSGKTTVTGMVGRLLELLGADPTVVNGGIVADWEGPDAVGNVRRGGSPLWVFEADESDRSLLRYRPDWAIITNISADHFSLEETRALFRQFAAQVKKGIVERDDAAEPWRSFRPEVGAGGSRFAYRGLEFRVPLLGRHNAENALQAVMLCERLGHPLDRIAAALPGFHGIRRRLETVGTARGVTVLDDYAHNPAKIRASWETVRPHGRRVIAAWRPHGFGPLAAMEADLRALFGEMIRGGAILHLLPVYYAGGTPKASVDSDRLARDLGADWAPDYETLAGRIAAEAREGDVVLVMGARDPDLPAAARRIVEALGGPSPS
jgi:UDP-N-acetylmuramate--alanine ligase